MNRPFFILAIFMLNIAGCSTDSVPDETIPQPLPINTPMVMGLLEATYDTVHHHPELVAGFVNNVDGYINPNSLDTIPVYNPTLWTQVVNTSKRFHLMFTPDDEAEIIVTGPIGLPEERVVVYSNAGDGVFGDLDHELSLKSGGQYQLDVKFSDGRTYRTVTEIPAETIIEVPDSIGLTVDYAPYNDGSAREESRSDSNFFIKVDYPDQFFLGEVQSNTTHDREILLMEPNEDFSFVDRSSFLRLGSLYAISMSANRSDSLRRQWDQDLYDKTKEEVWHSRDIWMRFSFFSSGIGGIFHPMDDIYTVSGEAYDEMFNQFIEAYEARNSSYLLETSTIQKVDDNGEVLPQEETDAIGFFAGYFSIYRTTTLYPIRTFDLDSVLMNNRVYNPDNTNP